MISATCDIRELISGLEHKDFFEMIHLLDQEATAVERQLFHPRAKKGGKQTCGAEYVRVIKNLIDYLRYGARPKGLEQEDLSLFERICEKYRVWEVH